MESMAIVASLVVAAGVVMITYLYASGVTPPAIGTIITWIIITFQRGLNVLSSLIGQSPLFPAVHQMGAAAAPVTAGAMGAVEAGARDVKQVLADAERAVADTVTPGAGLGSITSDIGDGGVAAAVDSELGYCYVGQGPGGRVCAPVSRQSGCMSGEYFESLEQCRLNSNRRLGASSTTKSKSPSIATEIGSLL